MVKPPLRTKSIGFKVSEEEYAQLETAAQTSGRTLGEWCRELVLASGQETKPTGPGGAEAQALMAELVALRAILLNVLFKAGERGEADGGGDATADRPGRLGQAEEGAGTAGAGGRVGRAAGREILKIF